MPGSRVMWRGTETMSAFAGDSAEQEESARPVLGLLTSPLKRVCFALCLLQYPAPNMHGRRLGRKIDT